MVICDLSEQDVQIIENKLEVYDSEFINNPLQGTINFGIKIDEKIVAGIIAQITTFRIVYVSTLYVDEVYRRKGLGRLLLESMEEKAKKLGINTIRLDTFDWQGKDFYLAMNYTLCGSYENNEDGYSELFFVKSI